MRAVAEIGVPRAFAEYRRQHLHTGGAATPIDVMRATRRPAHVHDARDSEPYRSGNPNAVAGVDLGGARTVLYVPMIRDDDIVGVINLYRLEVRPFTDEQIALLENFAGQAVIAIQNARLFNETKEALERQTATSEVLKVIASSPSELRPVFDAIAARSVQLVGGHSAAVSMFVGDRVDLGAFTPVSPEADAALMGLYPRRLADYPLFDLVRGGEVAQVTDIETEPRVPAAARAMARTRGFRGVLLVPMNGENGPVGVISITRREPGTFAPQDIQLMQTFADQAVIAIQNTRLFNETREALARQTATADILKVIASSPDDVQPVFQAIAERSNRIVEGLSTAVTRLVDDALHLMAYTPVSPEADAALQAFYPQPLAASHVSDALRRGEIVHIADSEVDFPSTPAARDLARKRGWRSALFVPLLRDGRPIGMISVTRVQSGGFADHHVQLLRTFADQAVIAISNVELFQQVQNRTKELSEALQFQTAASDVLKVISRSPDKLQPVLDAIVETSRELCSSDASTIFLFRDGKFYFAAIAGEVPQHIENLRANPLNVDEPRSLFARLIREKQTLHFANIMDDPELGQGRASLGGPRALLVAPLMNQGDVIGAIVLRQSHLKPFTQRQIQAIEVFADQAVIAISNVGLFEQVQAKTRDLQESLEQQTATSEVLGVISRSAGDLEPVFQSMLENATRISGAQFGLMNLREGDSFRTVAFHNVPPGFLSARKESFRVRPDSILAQMVETRQFAQVPDLSDTQIYAEGDPSTKQLVDLAGVRTVLVVPMIKNNELVGTIGIYRHVVSPFNEKQIALLGSFASQAVIAIENTRLLNELRQRTADLSRSLDDLRAAQDRLVQTEKLASLGQLTAGIAHEIKNPLNFVNNFSALSVELTDELNDVLKQAELAEKLRHEVGELTQLLKSNLEKVVQHGKRADSIVKNMLLHSREGSGEQRAADVNALVEESLNLAYHGARAEKSGFNITLQREFDASAGEAELFPQEMTRALLNLISNGFYAATRRKAENGEAGFEPTLLATTKNLGSSVEIRIRDNGTGIPPEVRQKMFNPFFTTKPAGEGTGLGLSMTHDIIVKQHRGTIDVATESGHFTEFIVVLPRANNLQNKSKGQA